MASAGGVTVSISLNRSSARFIKALAALVHAIDHADPALLEDSIAAACDELKASLRERDAMHLESD